MPPHSKIEKQRLKSLGNRIRDLRKKASKTQTDLGASIDSEYSAISRIENGRTNPSFLTLCQIADALNVSFEELTHEI